MNNHINRAFTTRTPGRRKKWLESGHNFIAVENVGADRVHALERLNGPKVYCNDKRCRPCLLFRRGKLHPLKSYLAEPAWSRGKVQNGPAVATSENIILLVELHQLQGRLAPVHFTMASVAE